MRVQRTIGFLKYQRESESDVPLKTELRKEFRNTPSAEIKVTDTVVKIEKRQNSAIFMKAELCKKFKRE